MMARTLLAVAAALTIADAAHVKEVEAWRAKHEADYRRDWVTVSGLHFLKPGDNRAGSGSGNDVVLAKPAPPSIGTFVLDRGHVRFEPGGGVTMLFGDGKPVTQAR